TADRLRPAQGVADLGVGPVPQAVEHGGCQVLRRYPAFLGLGPDRVGSAVDHAAADAAASQGQREDVAPVVAASPGVGPGGPAKPPPPPPQAPRPAGRGPPGPRAGTSNPLPSPAPGPP